MYINFPFIWSLKSFNVCRHLFWTMCPFLFWQISLIIIRFVLHLWKHGNFPPDSYRSKQFNHSQTRCCYLELPVSFILNKIKINIMSGWIISGFLWFSLTKQPNHFTMHVTGCYWDLILIIMFCCIFVADDAPSCYLLQRALQPWSNPRLILSRDPNWHCYYTVTTVWIQYQYYQ